LGYFAALEKSIIKRKKKILDGFSTLVRQQIVCEPLPFGEGKNELTRPKLLWASNGKTLRH